MKLTLMIIASPLFIQGKALIGLKKNPLITRLVALFSRVSKVLVLESEQGSFIFLAKWELG